MTILTRLVPGLALLTLAACTTMPSGPNVMVLPGTGKSFDQFRNDDYQCRGYAQSQLGGATPTTAMQESGVTSAAVGTLLGAAVGAAANGGHGAAVGAGTGLAVGGLAGTGAGQASGYGVQRRYDYAYLQCMYAQGHRIPSPGGYMIESYTTPSYTAPSSSKSMPPPPPPGAPPAPPPR
ncbi:hypothetical protein [Noviherbaspirillum pedocola]|uniref:Glycine-zipper-containing OmpA-like membrane domain-containing protein n=1 Tax=Noviherbaspirillum pedocola TaxID=2801341 RepID=A0A934T1R5_9BURK|nr:hypothetical protein [Noviherbaspirillum pedocola]MBK4737522.1 hypothetical protein [Noviherbaspirillum pedocola]